MESKSAVGYEILDLTEVGEVKRRLSIDRRSGLLEDEPMHLILEVKQIDQWMKSAWLDQLSKEGKNM